MLTSLFLLAACNEGKKADTRTTGDDGIDSTFEYKVDRFADIEILRYPVPGFNSLTLQQKELIYYLSQAALEGRDILWDQNNRYNLTIRRVCEGVYENYMGDKSSEEWGNFETYLKQIWMANGIHHHYSEDKIMPQFSQDFFVKLVKSVDPGRMPFRDGMAADETLNEILPVMFDPAVMPKRMSQTPGTDIVATSAVNFYEGVTQKEVEDFYNAMKVPNDNTPVSYGLNSKVTKVDGVVTEQVWKLGGMYDKAIERIIGWLEKAATVAENDHQKQTILSLIAYYKTGDLKTFDDYSVQWVTDTTSRVDFINGFIETYSDPLGLKATWESMVNFKSIEASERTRIISENAQWFEDNSPIDNRFKKEEVKGVSAKVITAAILGGDTYPSTPIGINLPNADWIRRDHGSKSVTIDNITFAYDKAAEGNGFKEEFMWSDDERGLTTKYGTLTDNLHTDLHECLGHGSGRLLPGVSTDVLQAYASPLEETRADLFALYYLADPKLVELGLLPDNEAYKAEYYSYIMNGAMTQLTRIQPGKQIEQAHMRNRATISNWVIEQGKADKVVELKERDGKTYVVVNDYDKLRALFGQLLAELQRIKSEGDFEAGKNLVETYGVKVNPVLHKEVLSRYEALNLAPYKGFVNPVYKLVTDENGKVTDVTISYEENYVDQQLRYARQYSVLPLKN
ncbi:MAG: dihydrofolate reductase [Bacteroidetes bacterium GWD2_45_23]|nr:MAG: dihydrofolate reductase [Bacteroidetes bacterium GWC2_46_850]OFX84782.1 MAG: dihydrofolate reductase [Bacteroidetes bacterium GWD2_45_23]HAR37832.1 dihydrofolate reductase [Porphyromonadaceae bacterium]HBB00583.1 dihydrofolate reductase [Porphyromonadaceae bacterium]HCC18276.1 dihydrofolate reductase [Porphyromonadaceae bacterium]